MSENKQEYKLKNPQQEYIKVILNSLDKLYKEVGVTKIKG